MVNFRTRLAACLVAPVGPVGLVECHLTLPARPDLLDRPDVQYESARTLFPTSLASAVGKLRRGKPSQSQFRLRMQVANPITCVICGHLRPSVAICGHLWLSVAICGICGYLRPSVAICGYLRLSAASCGSLRAEALRRPHLCSRGPLGTIPRGGRCDERINQSPGNVGNVIDRAIEGCLIGVRRLRETRELAHELDRRRANFFVCGRRVEVEERSNIPAHIVNILSASAARP